VAQPSPTHAINERITSTKPTHPHVTIKQIATHFITTAHGEDPTAVPDNVLLVDLDCKFDPLRIVQILNTSATGAGDNGARMKGRMGFHCIRAVGQDSSSSTQHSMLLSPP